MAITNPTNPTTADAIPYFLPNASFTVGTPTAQNIPAAKNSGGRIPQGQEPHGGLGEERRILQNIYFM